MTSGARPPAYSANINGFRGACVLLVFFYHVANSGLPPAYDPSSLWQSALNRLFTSFASGVELFFMISGDVIVQSLRRHASVLAFLHDHVLRIFPVWLPIAVALCIGSAVDAVDASWRWLEAALRSGCGRGQPASSRARSLAV